MSVIVVNKNCSSYSRINFKIRKIIGIAAPKVPARIKLNNIAKAIINPNK